MIEGEPLEAYLEEIRTLPGPARDPAKRVQRRQRMVRALREVAATHGRRRQRFRIWRRFGWGTLAVAVATYSFVVIRRPWLSSPLSRETGAVAPDGTGVGVDVIKGSVVLNRASGSRGMAPGDEAVVGAKDTFDTRPDQGAQLLLSDVANLTLSPDARIAEIRAQDGHVESIQLTKGRAHLWVRKLQAAHRFHVVTQDAEIQVRGTEFDVELGKGPSPHTCVRVQEGLVLVTSAGGRDLVGSGQTWGCDPAAAGSVDRVRDEGTQRSLSSPSRAFAQTPERSSPRRPRPALPASDLRAQNALFEQALSAERMGHYVAASELYRQLLARYPDGPLTAQIRANLAAMPAPR